MVDEFTVIMRVDFAQWSITVYCADLVFVSRSNIEYGFHPIVPIGKCAYNC
jgi:hypothetical protein